MHDIAHTALNIALQLGATYADVRVMERTQEAIAVKNGNIEGISSGTSRGFTVRVLAHGSWGFSSSATMDMREAERVAAEAVRIAHASAAVAGKPVRLSPLPVQHGSYATPIQRDPFLVPLNEKITLLLNADAAMRSVAGIAVTNGNIVSGRETKLFLSSDGSEIEQTLYD